MSALNQITGGVVRFNERKKTGDYEHRDVVVEINFSVGEGQGTAVLDHAAEEAMRKVRELLSGELKRAVGRPPKVNRTVDTTTATADPALEGAKEVLAPTKEVAATDRDPFEAEVQAVKATHTPPASSEASPASSQLAEVAEALVLDPFGEKSAGASSENSSTPEAANDEWTAEAAPITDRQLLAACGQKNHDLQGDPNGTSSIKKLVGTYVPAGKHVQDIPADKRAEFLDRLKALKKTAAAA